VGQFAALVLPGPPNMQGFNDLGPEAGTMMISHRFMGAGGHGRLLKLISARNICLEMRFDKRHFVPRHMIKAHILRAR
jgi:hypothetical protein